MKCKICKKHYDEKDGVGDLSFTCFICINNGIEKARLGDIQEKKTILKKLFGG